MKLMFWALAFVLIAPPATARDETGHWQQLYQDGKLADAGHELALKIAAHDGENSALYYNYGTIAARQNIRGEAVAALLAARHWQPRRPEIQANLSFVLRDITDDLAARAHPSDESLLVAWRSWLTLKELGWLAALVTALSGGLWIYAWSNANGVRWRRWAWASLAPVCLLGLMVQVKVNQPRWGAVVVPKTDVRSGPAPVNGTLFQLHDGAPVLVLAERPGWRKIAISDGKRGWVATDDLRVYQAGAKPKL